MAPTIASVDASEIVRLPEEALAEAKANEAAAKARVAELEAELARRR